MMAASLLASGLLVSAASAAERSDFTQDAFDAAQKAGKPILVEIHATWCPICKAQAPILADLEKEPRFKDLAVFHVDFDDQKDVVKRFGARIQSTLITFKGESETGRSVGDTNRETLAALLAKAL
jgi:thiol-disulfide isomerase/thioredoxin